MSSTPTSRPDDADSAQSQLYSELSAKLRCHVAREVNTSAENIEDACAHAWLKFVEVKPRGETTFAWLRAVAIRAAWRMAELDRRSASLETTEQLVAPARADIDFAEVVAVLRTIHPRRRELLLLHAAGFSSIELGARHGISQQRARELIYQARLQVARRSGRADQRR